MFEVKKLKILFLRLQELLPYSTSIRTYGRQCQYLKFVCFYILKKINFFKLIFFLVFLDYFDVLILKIIFKK